jgi:cytochrome oxidase Cu insertion factor (SCO1/SenC/PrrC family)
MSEEIKQQRKGRRMLVFLIVLFVLPILAVLGMYQFDYRPGGASHGELIAPPKALQISTVQDAQGKPFGAEQWKKKWNVVYVSDSGCAAECQKQVHLLRQIHVSLNKEIDRVQRILIVPSATDPAELAALQKQYPDLAILAGDQAAPLAQQFDLPGQPARTSGRVYFVDPLGNLMMSYPASYNPKGLREDITRLLKYSWVG